MVGTCFMAAPVLWQHLFDGSTCLMAPFWWFRTLMSERPEAWAGFDDIIQLLTLRTVALYTVAGTLNWAVQVRSGWHLFDGTCLMVAP